MRLTALILFAGCLSLCGCASRNKELANLSDHPLPDCEQIPTVPTIMTYHQFLEYTVTNSPGYDKEYTYEVVQDERGVMTARKMPKEFIKFSQDISRDNTKKVSIKLRAKKSSTARADAFLRVRLIIGHDQEHVFHLRKDPYEFSTTDTWEDLQYDYNVTINSDYQVATIQIYTFVTEPESIMVDDVVVEIEKSKSGKRE